MTAQAFMAEHIEKMGQSMVHFLSTTDPDLLGSKLETKGAEPARSVFELVGECAMANRYFASLLNGEESKRSPATEFANLTEAQDEIVASSQVLADTVRNASDEVFETEFTSWRGQVKGKMLMMGAYRNMAYHSGQINFIQILEGDHEFHMPPTWLN
jgi:hypothetical protein